MSVSIYNLLIDPVNGGWFPVDEFIVFEPQSDFFFGRLNTVWSVNDVATDLNAQISSDSTWGRVSWICSAQHHATSLDGI